MFCLWIKTNCSPNRVVWTLLFWRSRDFRRQLVSKMKKPRRIRIIALLITAVLIVWSLFSDMELVIRSPFVIQTIEVYEESNLEKIIDNMIEKEIRRQIDKEKHVQASLEAIRGADWVGVASYYSHDGCLGCHPQQLMANGEKFIEDDLTLAFNWLPLGTKVEVTNKEQRWTATAEVTDRHGAYNEKYGWRIADLSKGLKEKINCSDLCEVEIREI